VIVAPLSRWSSRAGGAGGSQPGWVLSGDWLRDVVGDPVDEVDYGLRASDWGACPDIGADDDAVVEGLEGLLTSFDRECFLRA
jgi:hypothetical protein